MHDTTGSRAPGPIGSLLRHLPAVGAALAIFAVARLGPTSPFGLIILLAVGLWVVTSAMRVAPLILFWAVPLSLYPFVYMPVMHYEAIVLVLAAALLGREVPRWLAARGPIPSIEARYLLFLASMLPGLLVIQSTWRFIGTFKLFAVGLFAFEVARRGARRLGSEAMLWGPAAFIALCSAVLGARVLLSGVPAVKSAEMRTYISQLPWGSSNYIAAVFVLCIPSIVLLIRAAPPRGARRRLAVAILAGTLAAMLITTSRGGFLLAATYLLVVVGRARRTLWASLGVVVLIALALTFTPFGQALLTRFVDSKAWISMTFRVMTWRSAAMRGFEHLPFGVGAGQGVLQKDEMQWVDPHNFPLYLFSEMGPATLLLWIWLIRALWSRASSLRSAPETRARGLALRDTLALACLNMMFEPTLNANLYHMLFWWLLGSLEGARVVGQTTLTGFTPIRPTMPHPSASRVPIAGS